MRTPRESRPAGRVVGSVGVLSGVVAATLLVGPGPAAAHRAELSLPGDRRITQADLMSARVPDEMCGQGFDLGRLKNGRLVFPDDPVGDSVWIADDPRTRRSMAFGPIRPGDRDGAALVLSCTYELRRWADHLVIYDDDLKILSDFVVARGYPFERRRAVVRDVRVVDGVVELEVIGGRRPSGGLRDDGSWTADQTFGWSAKKKRVVVRQKRTHSARTMTVRLLKAAERGQSVRLRRLATPEVARRITRLAREGGVANTPRWSPAVATGLDCTAEQTRRSRAAGADGVCWFSQHEDDSNSKSVEVVASWRVWWRKTGFRTWRAFALVRPHRDQD